MIHDALGARMWVEMMLRAGEILPFNDTLLYQNIKKVSFEWLRASSRRVCDILRESNLLPFDCHCAAAAAFSSARH